MHDRAARLLVCFAVCMYLYELGLWRVHARGRGRTSCSYDVLSFNHVSIYSASKVRKFGLHQVTNVTTATCRTTRVARFWTMNFFFMCHQRLPESGFNQEQELQFTQFYDNGVISILGKSRWRLHPRLSVARRPGCRPSGQAGGAHEKPKVPKMTTII